ncbi:MAG: helix-turn-helix domain-containing protein [Candidatus Komeilibacteria bacterium]
MHSFKQKHLEVGQTLGEQFTLAREAKKMTLTKVATILSIQEKYLAALEQSHGTELPGEAYARSWIKRYASYLDLDPEASLELYYQEKNIQANIVQPYSKPGSNRHWHGLILFLSGPRSLQRLAILTGVIIVFSYLIWFMIQTFQAPTISFDQPVIDEKTTASSMTISGRTATGVQLWFNDKVIMVDDQGLFRQDIPLSDGLNIITIHAKKKHSQEFEQTIQVVRTASDTAVATSTTPE